jgi:NAD/NADP transhydrogenase beta subunit
MPSRTVGILFSLVGASAIAVAVWGATLPAQFAVLPELSIPGRDWEQSWMVGCSILGVAGVATLVGGSVLAFGKWWGLLPLAAATALLAVFPWILRFGNEALYSFEAPHPLETATFALATVILLVTFFRKTQARVDA